MLRFDLHPAFPVSSADIDEVSVVREQGCESFHVMFVHADSQCAASVLISASSTSVWA
jgi:hypothetical protein